MPEISVFGAIGSTLPETTISLDAYLEEVRDGKWEDVIHTIRTAKTETEKDKLKKLLWRVTFSGLFSERRDECLIEHSGYIAIDLDDLEDPESVKAILSQDKYVYAAFLSSGGKGLTILMRINPSKHREAFAGISNYLFLTYGFLVDPQSVSPVKPFGFTWDPNLYINQRQTPMFTNYIKERKPDKLTNFAYAEDDFQSLLNQIVTRNVNLCKEYNEWMKIGFAFVDKFGENGRNFFHMVSSVDPRYKHRQTDKQYDYSLRSHKTVKIATISTFYWYCKEAGLQITSERTSKIRKVTLNSKAAGLKKEQIVKNLKDFEGITDAEQIVSDVYDGVSQIGDGESMIEQLELFISTNYNLRRNELTRFIERDGSDMSQRDFNSCYIAAKKLMEHLPYDLFERLMLSDFVKEYNPLTEYFERLPKVQTHPDGWWEDKHEYRHDNKFISPLIDKLAKTIVNEIPEFTEFFLRKWLVGIVSSAHGDHSPLLFVLLGNVHGTGKTEWFRRMPPRALRRYYAESKLDAGKDDEILMTQRLIIMDDELTGKSKREVQRLKELTSKQDFTLREPYGRVNVTLLRLAVLCGTSNFKEVLHDPTGNRRIIPVPVDLINQELYNTVDKDELFSEMYSLWRSGFDWRILSKEDIDFLRKYETQFEALNLERELIIKYFQPGDVEYLSSTEIKIFLETATLQKLSLDQVGKQLSKLGFEQKSIRLNKLASVKKWKVEKVDQGLTPQKPTGGWQPALPDDVKPF